MTDEKIKRYRSEFYDQVIQEIAKLGVERKDDYISRVVEIGYPPTIIQRWTEKFHCYKWIYLPFQRTSKMIKGVGSVLS
ncbi:hypothetical protein [Nitrosomonas aestuarii]|uniref:hypothetical protein n=1 Tax=Nitrosomonas aestuarii TaxID=52441 RepID=UPI0011B2278D|nr:hypothetical protein [Nitrosomonas aestuarii]